MSSGDRSRSARCARAALAAAAVLFAALAAPGAAMAASDEIQVYLDEMSAPGEIGVDNHVNDVLSGRSDEERPGELTPLHTLQVTPEFSYGVSRVLEAGLYLPFARSADGTTTLNGLKLRMKYMPHYGKPGWFWGLNVELSHVAERVSDEPWGLELRPILGWRDRGWLVAINPILGVPLRSHAAGTPDFEPAIKIARDVGGGVQVGLEHYAALGPLNAILPPGEREHLLVAAVDLDAGPIGLNVGVGRGLTGAGDRWVVKAIVGLVLREAPARSR